MGMNPALVGKSYPASAPYEVGREKIREFADAIGDDNPAYRDVEVAKSLGYSDVIAPPTFPTVLTFVTGRQVIGDPELGIDYSRVVHGEQRFIYSRPVQAGDRLSAVVTIDEIRAAGGNEILTMRSTATDADGKHVVDVITLLVVRGTAA
jgi:acyl dehydratase